MVYGVLNPKRENRSRFLTMAVPIGAATTAGFIGARAISKENRGDTFINTAKNCAKAYTKDNLNTIKTVFGDLLKMDRFVKKISEISPKKMFAVLFIGGVIENAVLIDMVSQLLGKKKNK